MLSLDFNWTHQDNNVLIHHYTIILTLEEDQLIESIASQLDTNSTFKTRILNSFRVENSKKKTSCGKPDNLTSLYDLRKIINQLLVICEILVWLQAGSQAPVPPPGVRTRNSHWHSSSQSPLSVEDWHQLPIINPWASDWSFGEFRWLILMGEGRTFSPQKTW